MQKAFQLHNQAFPIRLNNIFLGKENSDKKKTALKINKQIF